MALFFSHAVHKAFILSTINNILWSFLERSNYRKKSKENEKVPLAYGVRDVFALDYRGWTVKRAILQVSVALRLQRQQTSKTQEVNFSLIKRFEKASLTNVTSLPRPSSVCFKHDAAVTMEKDPSHFHFNCCHTRVHNE